MHISSFHSFSVLLVLSFFVNNLLNSDLDQEEDLHNKICVELASSHILTPGWSVFPPLTRITMEIVQTFFHNRLN